MLRDRGPSDVWERGRELAGGPFVVADQLQESSPGAVGQGMGDSVESVWRDSSQACKYLLT